jgi:hypothetical protein
MTPRDGVAVAIFVTCIIANDCVPAGVWLMFNQESAAVRNKVEGSVIRSRHPATLPASQYDS